MRELLLRRGRFVGRDSISRGNCLLRNGRIDRLSTRSIRRQGALVLNLGEKLVAPGFIDIHVHGGAGVDFTDPHTDLQRRIVDCHTRHGVTGLLATLLPVPVPRIKAAVRAITQAPGQQTLGIYLEGPFVSPLRKGAFNERCIRAPSAELLRELLPAKTRMPYVITIAPEEAGASSSMERALKNFLSYTKFSLPEAVRCASLNPARLLNIDDVKGGLEEGKDADLVVFDDELAVHFTIVGGDVLFAREHDVSLRQDHPRRSSRSTWYDPYEGADNETAHTG